MTAFAQPLSDAVMKFVVWLLLLLLLTAVALTWPDNDEVNPLVSLMRRGGVRKRLPDAASSAPTASARGGIRQRLNPAHDSAPKPRGIDTADKPLNKLVMRKWTSGKFTCKDVFEIGSAASEQGCPGIEQLATTDMENASRNLLAAVGYPEKAPKIRFIEVKCKDGSKRDMPILCPIDTLEKMVSSDSDRFCKCMRGVDGDIADFWYNMQGTTVYEKNKRHIDESKSMAVKIHADGAPTTKVDGLLTISWSTLHGAGATKEKKQVFATVPQSWKVNFDHLICRFVWAMNALIDGFLPREDWAGKPMTDAGRQLAGGWRLAPIFCVSDWEFYSNYCGFPTGQSVPRMCWRCHASPHDGPLCFCQVDPDAGWRETFISHEEYMEELRSKNQEPCALMGIKVLRLEGFLGDAMHGMDEGFTSEVAGNVFHEAMEARPEPNQKERAAAFDKDLKLYYKRVKETIKLDGKITYERVKSAGEWPCLKAKAAATRHVVPYCVELCERLNSGSAHDERRLLLCRCLDRCYRIMKSAGRFLTAGEKSELKHMSQTMMQCYRNLSLDALELGIRAWKMKPKLHETQHILEYSAAVINPVWVWLYSDEDLQQHIKKIAVQCHPSTVAWMCLFRWVVHTFGEYDD